MHGFFLSVLCLGLAVGSLAKPQPCRSPPLLQGHKGTVVPKMGFYGMEEFFYDGFGQRECRRAVVHQHNQTILQEEIFLHKEGVYYKINRQNQTCKKSPWKTPWFTLEIPQDATFQGQAIIGSSSGFGEGLLVNSWSGKLPEFQIDQYYMTYTQFGCLPVSITTNQENVGMVFRDFYDLVVGIEDPNVFIPPAYCEE